VPVSTCGGRKPPAPPAHKSPGCHVKGAARRPVRPKSREETPKEGSETNDRVAGLAISYVDVRRTKSKRFFLHCRNSAWHSCGKGCRRNGQHSTEEGAARRPERPKSREETPKVGCGTSVKPDMPQAGIWGCS
jgi:hypothetical protein